MSANLQCLIRSTGVLVSAILLSGCGTVALLPADESFDRRIYAGGGVLLSHLDPDTGGVEGIEINDSNSGGAALLVGYDVSDRFTLEGHIADLGDASLSPDGSVSYQVGGLSGIVYGFNSQADRARRQGFSVFGRLGIGGLNNDTEGVLFKRINDVHLLAGVGLEYGFGNRLAARVELLGHEVDARYAQLALVYRFGDARDRRVGGALTTPPAERVADESDVSSGIVVVPVPDQPLIEVEPLVGGTTAGETIPADAASDLPSSPEAAPEKPLSESAATGVPDEDVDGVSDNDDACPGTTVGLPVDLSGCELFDGAIEGINFLVGSAELTEGAISVLEGVVLALQNFPDIKITIEAHTDNRGDADENLQLSRRRALAVARYLVGEGISGLRLRPQAFGESQPRATNSSAKGRAANRRVEFTVFK